MNAPVRPRPTPHFGRPLRGLTVSAPSVATVAAATVLMLIALRPIVDLAGRYEGNGLNLGGAVGIAAAFAALMHFLLTPWRRPILVYVALVAWVALLATTVVVLVARGLPDLTGFARLAAGFAPLLLVTTRARLVRSGHERLVIVTAILVVVTATVPIVIAWLQFAGLVPFTYFDFLNGQPVGRPSGGYFQPNSLARLAIFCALILITLRARYPFRLSLLIAAIAVLGATTVISTHRTSMVIFAAVIAAYAVYAFMAWRERREALRTRARRSIAVVAIAGSALGATALGIGLASGAVGAVVAGFEQSVAVMQYGLDSIKGIGEGYFLRGRGVIWSTAIETYLSGGVLGLMFGFGYEPLEAHNDLLRMLLMHGAAGVAAFALLFIALFIEGMRRTNVTGRFTLLVLFGYLALYAVPLHPTAYPFFMWLFLLTYLLVLVVHDRGGAAYTVASERSTLPDGRIS